MGRAAGLPRPARGRVAAIAEDPPGLRPHLRPVHRLAAEGLGRAPRTADLTRERVLAYRNHREHTGGRDGTGVSAATLAQELSALRQLAGDLGLALGVQAPRIQRGTPATITPAEYTRLIRAPDGRRTSGRRDIAVLRVLGETGLRSAELRALTVGDLTRLRHDARHQSLRVRRGKGGRDREVPLNRELEEALAAWLAYHPHRVGRHVPTEAPLFCTTRSTSMLQPGRALTHNALAELVTRHATAAGIPKGLGRPHVLRAYYLTCLAERGVPIHRVARLAGHADIRTTSRYLAVWEKETGSNGGREVG